MEKRYKKIGVLTSGGDAPGMNCAVRAVTRLAIQKGLRVVGIYNGYDGLLKENFKELKERDVSSIMNHGGTMLYTSRSDRFKSAEGLDQAAEICRRHEIDGIVTIGGDGTFRGAADLVEHGVPCIGVPGTIDNDIAVTDATIGFDTAMSTVVELVDKIRDTCESHARCNVVEVMGRRAGDIAISSAIATGATAAVVREFKFDEEVLFEKMRKAKRNGKRNFIIIVSEGKGKHFGEALAEQIEASTGINSNFAKFAHVQRGGSPTLSDRVLATRMGAAAVEELLAGNAKRVIALQNTRIVSIDIAESQLADAIMKHTVTPEMFEKFSPEVVERCKARVEEVEAKKKQLYDLVDIMSL